MTITLTKLYSLLSDKLGKDTAENLTEYIEAKMETDLKNMNVATKSDIAELRGDFKTELAKVKADMIKWGASLFVVTVILIVGLYFK